ncbi:FAD-dependent monooxygenase [Streptomyces sp. NPDC057694]|uniref:FAD-dependent monooxygenase n=1 Tax=Streptomyces sp. NPDC057694 TaxID=3346216 RepID=UPI003683056E
MPKPPVHNERTECAAETVPVLIAGAGPSGLALALELSAQGVAALLVEPRRTIDTARPRAKTVSARTMELFRRWGVSRALREAAPIPAQWSSRITFCESVLGQQIGHLDGAFALDLTDSELVAEGGQQMPQPTLERVLREKVARAPGVELRLGSRVAGVVEKDGFAEVALEDDQGTREYVHAQWVVGADGARSIVREAMGAHYDGGAAGRQNVNITFRCPGLAESIPHVPSLHYWVLNYTSPGVVGPLDLDGTWWAISTGTEHVSDAAEARSIVCGLLGQETDVEIVATDPWQARMLLADRYRSGRLFVIGDAAHQNPPWGGHGFNTGVGDAANLGWKLGAVLRGWADENLLDSYASERRPIARRTLDLAERNMRAVSTDLLGDTAEEIISRKRDEFHSLGLVLGYGYTPAADEQAPEPHLYAPHTQPGNRLPHRRLPDGSSLFDQLSTGFTVFGAGQAAGALTEELSARAVPVQQVSDPAVLTLLDQPVVLVRPDQHIAWAGRDPADVSAVATHALQGFQPSAPRQWADAS